MTSYSKLTLATVLGLGLAGSALPLAVVAQSGPDGATGGMPAPGSRFAAMDKDGDGRITREEMAARRAEMVAGLDADGDGFLSAAEIAAFHLRGADDRANAHAARMIERMDADGDGRIGVAEMMASRGGGDGMFDRMDADDDGALTRDEMMQHRSNRGGIGERDHDCRRSGMDGKGSRDHHGNR